jgi:hypothetical protein
MHAVLDRLGVGDRHEAHADGCVLAGPDDDLVLPLGEHLPAGRLRPEPGQAGQVVSVNDDVVKSDGHADSMRHAGPYHRNPPSCRGRANHRRSRHATASRSRDQRDAAAAREPGRLSTWLTEDHHGEQPSPWYLCKISADMVGSPIKLGQAGDRADPAVLHRPNGGPAATRRPARSAAPARHPVDSVHRDHLLVCGPLVCPCAACQACGGRPVAAAGG